MTTQQTTTMTEYQRILASASHDPETWGILVDTTATLTANVLEGRTTPEALGDSGLLTIAATVDTRLPVRDAVLIAAINTNAGLHEITDYARNPHDADNVRHLYHVLDTAFNNPTAIPGERVSRGYRLATAADHMAGGTAQTSAMAAYLAWYMADTRLADEWARHAFDIDNDCTLARIVSIAATKDMLPAWARRRG